MDLTNERLLPLTRHEGGNSQESGHVRNRLTALPGSDSIYEDGPMGRLSKRITKLEGTMRRSYLARGLLSALLLLIAMQPGLGFAQITFERTYGGDTLDAGYSVRQTSDGGYIIVGRTLSYGAGDLDVYLVKTDSLGELIWERTYGGDKSDGGNSVEQTADGGYIIAGYTGSFGAEWQDVYVVRVSSSGDTLWTRTFGGLNYDVGISVRQTSDGGYVVAGMTTPYDAYLIRMEQFGNPAWERTYGGIGWDAATSVSETEDGGFSVAGGSESFGSGGKDYYLVRVDSAGDTLWERRYGGSEDESASEHQPTWDGGWILAGDTESFGFASPKAYLVKTDSAGGVMWEQTYGGNIHTLAYSVYPTIDSGFVFVGTIIDTFCAGQPDLYIVRIDSSGNTLWEKAYGGSLFDNGYCVRQTSDGGYIATGSTKSFGTGHGDVYLVKLGPDGQVSKDASVVSLDAPADTVFCDSTYQVNASVANLGNAVFSFHVIATIDGYVDTALVNGLEPDSASEVSFNNWHVPTDDSIVYTMRVCTHAFSDIDTTNDCMQKEIFAYNPTGVEEALNRPSVFDFRLWQNSPNPFHRSTAIQYSLPVECDVTLSVYGTTGRLMETIVDQRQGAGVFRVQWLAERAMLTASTFAG